MARKQHITNQRIQRARRSRAKFAGNATRPRLSLTRSNLYLEAQLIDDTKGLTLCAVHDREVKIAKGKKDVSLRMQRAYESGQLLAEKAKKKKITQAVFDRRGSKYHGRVAEFARGAREGGLTF